MRYPSPCSTVRATAAASFSVASSVPRSSSRCSQGGGVSLDPAEARVPEKGRSRSAGGRRGVSAGGQDSFVGSGHGRIRTTFPSCPDPESPPLPRRPPRRRRKPGLHLLARRVRPAPGRAQTPAARPALRLRPRAAAAPAALPSPFLPRGSGGRPQPTLPGLPLPFLPSPRSVFLTLGLGP